MRTAIGRVLGILVVLVIGGALAAPASAFEAGVADSDSTTFTDGNWGGLGIRYARAVVPYDVAITSADSSTTQGARRVEFDKWVSNAAAQGAVPLVSFERSLSPSKFVAGNPVAPSRSEYLADMRAFLRQYPTVRDFTPWNEPNFNVPGQNPLHDKPALAADFWLDLKSACQAEAATCQIAAGDFAGVPGDDAYVDPYQAELGGNRPSIWAFHAHTDANRYQAGTDSTAPATRYFLSKLGGPWEQSRIWIDEIGAYWRDANSTIWGDASQRDTASFILGLTTLSSRIDRIYYYNLSNQCSTATRCAVQDRGLVSPKPWDGTPLGYDSNDRKRPAYTIISDRGPLIAPSTPDFSLSASPTSQSVVRGKLATYTIFVTPRNGFNSPVSMSVTGLPPQDTATFTPSGTGLDQTMTVTTSSTDKPGGYTLTVTGRAGTLSHTTTVTLNIKRK